MEILTLFVVFYILLSISLFFLFRKVGKPAWHGLIPILQFLDWLDLIGRPRWHIVYLFIPIVNLFYYSYFAIEMVRSFGLYRFVHSVLAVVATPLVFFYLAFSKAHRYIEPAYEAERRFHEELKQYLKAGETTKAQRHVEKSPYSKSNARIWVESIIFAVMAAAFIRMFLIEAYVIPTASMEDSLLVGDYLFVSKVHYGLRTPMTVIQVPLLHNRIPILGTESYLKKPSLPYYRLPALTTIKHNDPFVFNWPIGDSVYILPDRSYAKSQVERNPKLKRLIKQYGAKLIVRPIDKKDHYIKRVIALPGDTLQIINREVYINGQRAKDPKYLKHTYRVYSRNGSINPKLLKRLGIRLSKQELASGFWSLTNQQVEKLRAADKGLRIEPQLNLIDDVFPHDDKHFGAWTIDNYGPIWIPKKGKTIPISVENIALYKRIIGVYEHNDLVIKGDTILINGQPADHYTFKQNYYWAMGDNRHQSEDSRFWGFVPEDHIVGKPLFIFFSTVDGSLWNGIRLRRLFTSANKM